MSLDYSRKPSETFKAYKIRLCRNKDVYGLSWKQIAALLNAESDEGERDESTYRKWWNAYVEGYEDSQGETVNSDILIQEINKRKQELEVARQSLLDERREVLKEKRLFSRTQWMAQKIHEVTTSFSPVKPFVIIKPSDRKPRRTLCVLYSDGQVGELIQPPDTAGFNTYNINTFVRRSNAYADNVIEAARELEVEAVSIFQLGDSIEGSGRIYKRQRNYLDAHVIRQIFAASETQARFVEAVVGAGVPNVSVYAIAGNHGLDGYDSHENANFEWLVYDRAKLLLKEYVKEYDINYEIANTFMQVVPIYGYNFLCLHGDSIRKSEISRAFYRYSHMYAQRGIQIYSMLMGHWHSFEEKDVMSTGGDIIINGNIAGANRLEIERMHADTKPAQVFFIVEEGVGITYRRKVVLPD
jgi:hypothetical protein